jgi:purine-binding chemotaxis protein CheW
MGDSRLDTTRALLVRAGGALCAIPLHHVVETMRPLPTTELAGAPPFLAGVAVIRGEAVPVVELRRFLGPSGEATVPSTRFVVVRAGARRFALAVEAVVATAELATSGATPLPLLGEACRSAIESVGALDDELLMILSVARVVPAEVWSALPAAGATPP